MEMRGDMMWYCRHGLAMISLEIAEAPHADLWRRFRWTITGLKSKYNNYPLDFHTHETLVSFVSSVSVEWNNISTVIGCLRTHLFQFFASGCWGIFFAEANFFGFFAQNLVYLLTISSSEIWGKIMSIGGVYRNA